MDSKSEPSDTVLVGRLQCKTDFYFRQKFNLNSVNYGRMEEQRCFLQPSRKAEAEAFFKIITSSQSRLDDQRAVLPTLPGIRFEPGPRHLASNHMGHMLKPVKRTGTPVLCNTYLG
uniref:Uncharacterized protein n=1 Tax=Amphilophus citrinellus TaxID=61819 RepID=A0A3Q0SLS2_AMPCI